MSSTSPLIDQKTTYVFTQQEIKTNTPYYGYTLHLANPWTGMPDRESYHQTPYIPSEFEMKIIRVVEAIFDTLFNNPCKDNLDAPTPVMD